MTVRWMAALVAVLVAGTVLAVVFGGTEVSGRPTARDYDDIPGGATAAMCRSAGRQPQVVAYFSMDDTDTLMRTKAEELTGDERFASIEQETQAQAYERFLVLFSDEEELIEQVRPDTLPASLWLTPAGDLPATELLADLEDELTGPEVDDLAVACRDS